MIVACWSGPRNISTALMRSWSSRKDTFVTDEPFYAYYLKKTKFKHPMHSDIIKKYPNNYNEIINFLTGPVPGNKKIWYQKHMAHHLIDVKSIDFIKNFENCILLRHPKEVISSYVIKNELNNVEELGFPQQFEIANFLIKKNLPFVIKDSKDILLNPKLNIIDWCKRININFDRSMLTWKRGYHPNDGIWAEHWYDNVVNSTRFKKYKEKDITIENKYDSIYNDAMKYFNYLIDLT